MNSISFNQNICIDAYDTAQSTCCEEQIWIKLKNEIVCHFFLERNFVVRFLFLQMEPLYTVCCAYSMLCYTLSYGNKIFFLFHFFTQFHLPFVLRDKMFKMFCSLYKQCMINPGLWERKKTYVVYCWHFVIPLSFERKSSFFKNFVNYFAVSFIAT